MSTVLRAQKIPMSLKRNHTKECGSDRQTETEAVLRCVCEHVCAHACMYVCMCMYDDSCTVRSTCGSCVAPCWARSRWLDQLEPVALTARLRQRNVWAFGSLNHLCPPRGFTCLAHTHTHTQLPWLLLIHARHSLRSLHPLCRVLTGSEYAA